MSKDLKIANESLAEAALIALASSESCGEIVRDLLRGNCTLRRRLGTKVWMINPNDGLNKPNPFYCILVGLLEKIDPSLEENVADLLGPTGCKAYEQVNKSGRSIVVF